MISTISEVFYAPGRGRGGIIMSLRINLYIVSNKKSDFAYFGFEVFYCCCDKRVTCLALTRDPDQLVTGILS